MTSLRRQRRRSSKSDNWLMLFSAAAVAVTAVLVLLLLRPAQEKKGDHTRRPPADATKPVVKLPPPPPFRSLVHPTPQASLVGNESAFQATASEDPRSGLYGFVRTSRFHEGIDIAATKRDKGGRPLDQIRAAAAGTVGHINRVAGNSNYGIYIVLVHDDPVGPVYTLYAHLANVEPGIAVGQHVDAGTVLGLMGNTPASIIPMSRAHLHFEIGLIANSRFRDWFHARRLKPDHGLFNGWNLIGMDPLPVFAAHRMNPDFSLADHLRTIPVAFTVAIVSKHQLNLFLRYHSLWSGPPFDGGPIVIKCSENGLPLEGRNATEDERKSLGRSKAAILDANESLLGRNTGGFIVRSGNGWKLGRRGEQWLDILTY